MADIVKPLWIPGLAMAAVVAMSNYLVQFPLNDWITLAAFTYPLAFWVTDLTNRWAGPEKALKVAYLGLFTGLVISLGVAPSRIAIASGTAFICAQLLDISVFNQLRKKTWWKAPFIGSIVGSTADTFLFFSLAFAGTELNWVALACGDLFSKFVMAVFLLAPYRMMLNRIHTDAES